MNGAQDLGGMMGFGPVVPEPEDEIFHAEWERTAFALTLAMGGLGRWNIDTMRHARESLHPRDYLGSSYYEIWTKALIRLMLDRGMVSETEIASGHADASAPVPAANAAETARTVRAVTADEIGPMLARGTRYDRTADRPAAFAVGDRVLTRHDHPYGHTRLPRYARGKQGVIERVIGFFVFPDSAAAGQGDAPQWLYTVCFDGPTLWGSAADPASTVTIDAWESYLEQV